MKKHDWNSLQHYLDIHEKTLRFYQRFMEEPKSYFHQILNIYYHTLSCSKIILSTYKGTRVRVDLYKEIEVDPEKRSRARTIKYKYQANIPIGGTLIRYCSPHEEDEEESKAPHHPFHHKHDFTKTPEGEIILLGNDKWPHVGEFFEEVLSEF